jgi:AcrR family transcriptional regulator
VNNIILILNSNSTILFAMPQTSNKPGSETAAKSAKGERARAGLKAAALRVLERQGYHKMRIADVTQEAGVAQGLFYHYFKDLKSLTLEVLSDFASASNDPHEVEKDVPKGDWYARIYAHNLVIVRSYDKRPGVMRCLLQLADEDEAFSGMLRENYRNQLMWLVDVMPKLFPDVRFRPHQALMVVYSLAGIGEGLLREYFINESKTLRAADLSVEQFTELLSTMYYRALFLQHPDEKQLKYTKNLSSMVRDS